MAGKRSLERKKERAKSGRKLPPRNKDGSPGTDFGEYDSPRDQAETPVEGGGTLQGFRSGFRRAAGADTGPRTLGGRILDIALWVAAGAALFLVLKRYVFDTVAK